MTTKEQKHYIHQHTESLIRAADTPKSIKIVAEGDSWFDYPLSKDIIDWLAIEGYAIKNFSTHGDILENMVYGTKVDENTQNKKKSLDKLIEAIEKYEPSFVLLSGGGNDVVGENMIQFLNHSFSGYPHLRSKEFTDHINKYVKSTIRHFCERVWMSDSDIHILMDGYAYAKANGKAYKKVWISWAGPWILPGFQQKGILNKSEHENIIKQMVDIFNDMLHTISDEFDNFHYIDLRPFFPNDNQWDNEIHLTNEGYKIAANIYHHNMMKINNSIKNQLENLQPTRHWPQEVLV